MSDPRPLAVLFVDISGSTQLYEQLGDARALARVEACLRLLQAVTEELGGRVIKTTGDGLMCAFEDAAPALQAARVMQTRVLEQHELGGPALAIHVGCHYGPTIEMGGDLYGDAVNVAARVAGLANVGQVIVTQDAVARLGGQGALELRMLDRVVVKGKREPLAIHELLWQGTDDATLLGTRLTEERPPRLRLAWGGRELWFDGSGKAFLTLGRDATCDLVVEGRKASRQHARIEWRRDKFVLVDRSANGTFVRIADGEHIALRREELVLRLKGLIAAGHRTTDPDATVVEYYCD